MKRLSRLFSIYKKAAGIVPKETLEYIQRNGYKYFSEFTNELGNEIAIGVKSVVDETEEYSFDAVNIIIEGPSSTSENTITYQEAVSLSETLKNFLEDSKIKSSTLTNKTDLK